MKTFKLHFIRHGITDGNLKGQYIGVTDLPVTTNGIQELENLRNTGIYPNINMLFSSPMTRCLQTCRAIYPELEPIVIPEMREYDFGDFEGKTAFEIENSEEYKAWTSGRITAPPNGEEGSEFLQRICLGLNKIVRAMSDIGETNAAVVLHGGVIMTLFAATAVPRRNMVEWTTENGMGYTARITPSLYGKSGVIEIIDTVPSSFNEEG